MRVYRHLYYPLPLPHEPRPGPAYRGRRPTACLLEVVRCPLCRAPLVARMGRRGPSFYCLCPEHPGELAGVAGPARPVAEKMCPVPRADGNLRGVGAMTP